MLLATGAAARAAIRPRLLPAAGLPSVAFASIDPSCTRQFAAAARGGSAGGKEAGADKYAQAHESMGAFKSPIVKALWDRRGASKRQDLEGENPSPPITKKPSFSRQDITYHFTQVRVDASVAGWELDPVGV